LVGLDYDPLLAKLVVSGPDRSSCIARAHRALEDWVVLGVETNKALLSAVIDSKEFISGDYATDFVPRLTLASPRIPDAAWIAATLSFSDLKAGDVAVSSGEPWDAATGWRSGR
jgi:acetyl/propionyl-CoA carboxylase alpha subunit